jgi:hypothetical protein
VVAPIQPPTRPLNTSKRFWISMVPAISINGDPSTPPSKLDERLCPSDKRCPILWYSTEVTG